MLARPVGEPPDAMLNATSNSSRLTSQPATLNSAHSYSARQHKIRGRKRATTNLFARVRCQEVLVMHAAVCVLGRSHKRRCTGLVTITLHRRSHQQRETKRRAAGRRTWWSATDLTLGGRTSVRTLGTPNTCVESVPTHSQLRAPRTWSK
jgi:hypothetical protein